MPCNNAQTHQFQMEIAGRFPLLRGEEFGLVDLEQRGRGVGALKIAAEADELPALTVDHAGIGGAFEEVDAVDDRGELVADVGSKVRLRVRQVHLVVKTVEALPHLRGDFFAHLAGVFAGSIEAINDRGWAEIVVDQLLRHFLDATVPLHLHRLAECGHHALPSHLHVGAAGIEHQAHGHVEQAHRILRSLQVAAHPVEAVGNAR